MNKLYQKTFNFYELMFFQVYKGSNNFTVTSYCNVIFTEMLLYIPPKSAILNNESSRIRAHLQL